MCDTDTLTQKSDAQLRITWRDADLERGVASGASHSHTRNGLFFAVPTMSMLMRRKEGGSSEAHLIQLPALRTRAAEDERRFATLLGSLTRRRRRRRRRRRVAGWGAQ